MDRAVNLDTYSYTEYHPMAEVRKDTGGGCRESQLTLGCLARLERWDYKLLLYCSRKAIHKFA